MDEGAGGEKRACETFGGQGTRKREMKCKYRIYPIKKIFKKRNLSIYAVVVLVG